MKDIFILAITLLMITSCSKEGDDDSGGGSGGSIDGVSGVEIEISSDEVSFYSVAPSGVSAACSLSIGGSTHNGNCLTPISLKAKVSQIQLNNSFGGAPSRLIDFSATEENDPLNGPHGVLGLSTYDFSESAENNNPYSDDGLQDSTSTYYNSLALVIGAMELKFEVPAGNGNVTDRFWTVRYMLYPHNPLDNSSINSCVTENSIRTKIENGGDLYSDPSGFEQGDILICQKNTSGETCVDGDYKWVDSADGSLDTTRPASPVRLSGTYMFQDNSCSGGGGDLVMGGSNFRVNLAQAMQINKSRTADACLYKYEFQTNCTTTGESTGSCSDAAQEGFGINVAIDFDLTNAIFAINTVDLDSDSEVGLLQNLHKILPKPLYVENKKSAVGTGDDTGVDASVSITVDNDAATTAIQEIGDDPNDYDSNFCFIENQ